MIPNRDGLENGILRKPDDELIARATVVCLIEAIDAVKNKKN
jgi:hypothetical protein